MRDVPDKRAVCWDLDSTLADTRHRQHMVPLIRAGKATWLEYSLHCADDEPIEGAVTLARLLYGARVWQFAVSGRSASAEGATRDWLKRYQVPLDDVFLRPDGDYTENGLFKVRVLGQLRDRGFDVVLFIDDWQETADIIQAVTPVPVLVVKGVYEDGVEGSV
jgi:hypothetical protein